MNSSSVQIQPPRMKISLPSDTVHEKQTVPLKGSLGESL